ncbi:Oxysterol-binding protein 3 [Entomophthora muscae]|uniref:Oxysterol-binding protein 3 n=2 Tax=Entomophthora muscae TaxID=34485 RepID=A0ACC2UR45_9FUNG|nr:Oxysterol-binding protein 3 [Entomophthora muscae]
MSRVTSVSGFQEILPIKSYDAYKVKIKGEHKVEEPGIYILYFDNSHSWSTSKRLTFVVSTHKESEKPAAESPVISGWVLKKKRKKMQGWAKRWCFIKDGTLSYAKDEKSIARGSIQIPHSVATFDYSLLLAIIDSGSSLFRFKFLSESDFQAWESIIIFYLQQADETLGLPFTSEPDEELAPHPPLPVADRYSILKKKDIVTDSPKDSIPPPPGNSFGSAEKKLHELFSNLDLLNNQFESYLYRDDLASPDFSKEKDRLKYISFRSKKDPLKTTDASPMTSNATLNLDISDSIRNTLRTIQSQRTEVLKLFQEETLQRQKLETAYKIAKSDSNHKSSACAEPLAGSESAVSFQPDTSFSSKRHFRRRSVYARRQTSILSISTIGNGDEEFFDALEGLEITQSSNSSDQEESDDPDIICDDSDEESDTNVCFTEPGPPPSQTKSHEKFELGPAIVSRRTELPSPICGDDISFLSILRKNVGKDLATISLPISLNEPLNILQRLCEELEYSGLLDKANSATDSLERLIYVTAFALSPYAASGHRASRKPFNPLLGETYECMRPDKGFRFIAEKVSHTPPVFACHAESKNFTFWQDSKPKSKFWGKSMELLSVGTVHVILHASNEHFTFNKAVGCMRNLVAGNRYLEYQGDVVITNRTTGEHCKLNFKESTFFSSSNNEVKASLYDATGALVHTLEGQWSAALTWKKAQPEVLWKPMPLPPNAAKMYSFTQFAIELNEITPDLDGTIPDTDTRLRPDQSLFEHGDVSEAEKEKVRLEEGQRIRRRERESLNQAHVPAWFHLVPQIDHEGITADSWVYKGGYWEARQAKNYGDLPKLW